MKALLVVLASCCIGFVLADDSVAMESETRHQIYPREEVEEDVPQKRPFKNGFRGEKRRNFVHRDREAREYVFELPPGYEIEGKEPRFYAEEHIPRKQVQKVEREEKENLKPESSQYPGSYLSHIKEQMNDGKLLGFSSFVEHFSENDDAEELKTAMREGSLDDIKKLVPKSSVSFQMYHGQDEQRAVKAEPIPDKKQEVSWNEINAWHQPTAWTPPQAFYNNDRKKRMRKHPTRANRPSLYQQSEEPKAVATPEPENNVYQETYQIIPAINYELSGQTRGDNEIAGAEQERQESQTNYHEFNTDKEQASWRPVAEKPTVKPPESSKLYYEHIKYSKPFEESSKFSQLPKVGRIVVDQPTKTTLKKPLRLKPTSQPFKRPSTPSLASGEDFNQRYAQIPTVTPVPVRFWSKTEKFRPETPKRVTTPVKLEKILNKQTENHQSKENGNIFLTKEFQSEVSEYFKGGKSDFEWVPSTQIRYDNTPHGSNPVSYHAKPENPPEHKPKRYRIYRSNQPKNVVFLGPENEHAQGEFPVSASYKIDKNRKSDEQAP